MKLSRVLFLAFLIPTISFSQEFAYQPGEKVSYVIHYGLVQGGIASLELKTDTFAGKEVWHAKILGKTTGIADAIFRMKDIYESYIEPETELPVFSIRNIQEGRYRKYNEVSFDRNSRPDSAILTSDLSGIHITEKEIHDILSCFYYFRNHDLKDYRDFKKGDMITINTWFTDEYYPIRLRFQGIDDVRTKIGKIKCIKFNPVTETGRLFKTENDLSIWFTADSNFLPVKVRFDLFVGSFSAEIVNYEGSKYPIKIIKKEPIQNRE
jgi:hypothetical protein